VPLEEEQLLLEAPLGVNAEEAFTEHHKGCHLHDAIGCEIVELQPVGIQQPPDKGVEREGEATGHVVDKHDPLPLPRARDDLIAGETYLVGVGWGKYAIVAERLECPGAHTGLSPVSHALLGGSGSGGGSCRHRLLSFPHGGGEDFAWSLGEKKWRDGKDEENGARRKMSAMARERVKNLPKLSTLVFITPARHSEPHDL
jgi:hypothetical protein